MDLFLLFQHGLIYGAILSVVLSVLIIISMYINAEIWASDYPPDIQENYIPVSEKTQKQKIVVSIAFLGIIFGLIGLAIMHFDLMIERELSFLDAFCIIFVMLLCFNLIDLLVLDWLFFINIQPNFIVLPGTEGLKGYDDYYFHFRGFLIGMVIISVASLLFAGILTVLSVFL